MELRECLPCIWKVQGRNEWTVSFSTFLIPGSQVAKVGIVPRLWTEHLGV
jgi:hypothetical protein